MQDRASVPRRTPLTSARTRGRARRARGGAEGRRLRARERPGGDRQDRAARRGPCERDDPVLIARGIELERAFAFGGVQQLFARVPVPARRRGPRRRGVLGRRRARPASLHGLYWLAAGLGPLAIVVDDAHWLDRRRCAGSRTWSTGSRICRSRSCGAQRRAGRSSPASPCTVDPRLNRSHARCAGRRRARRRRARRRRYEATGGNPFYVHALLAEGDTPRPVVDSVALRLDGFRPRARRSPGRSPSPEPAGRSPRGWPALTCAAPSRPPRRSAAADILRGEAFAHPLVRTRSTRRSPTAPTCTPRPPAWSPARARRRPGDGRRPRPRRLGGEPLRAAAPRPGPAARPTRPPP